MPSVGTFIYAGPMFLYGMQPKPQPEMARRRALLTDRERELLAGENVDDPNYRYQAASRIRNKIHDELADDIDVLAEHHPDLLNELREVVCDGE